MASEYQVLKSGSKKKFLKLDGRNRPTDSKHVREIMESVLLYGKQLRPVVVAKLPWIGPGLHIIDGQHLNDVLVILEWDIQYVEVIIKDQTDLIHKLAKINSSSKPWSVHDYIRVWGMEKDDYRKLAKYYPQYTLDVSNLASILSGRGPAYGGQTSPIIKSGQFEIVNEKDTVTFLNNLQDILNIAKLKNSKNTRYVSSEYYNLMATTTKYDHKAFVSKLTKDTLKLKVATATPGELFKN